MGINEEFDFILRYVDGIDFEEKGTRECLRCLWIAFCLHHAIDVNTCIYDHYLRRLWNVVQNHRTCVWKWFECFDVFIHAYIV